MEFLQTCIDGLLFGSAYSLLALSFSLLFGVMKRINLAFGSTLLLSAVFSLWIDSLFSIGIFGIFLVMLASSALINIYVEKLCFYPHSGRYGATVSMISSFAIWMQLDEMSSFLLPDRTASFPSFLPDSFFLNDLFIRIDQLFLFLIGVFMTSIFFYVIYKTNYGLLLRGVSFDGELAKKLGVNSGKISSFAFAFSGVFGAIAAFLILSTESQVTPFFGFWCTLKGLVAMMLGGIGSLPGAIIGGLFLGLVESNVINYLGAEYRDICTYLILLFILVVKPGGIMGSALLRDERAASERI